MAAGPASAGDSPDSCEAPRRLLGGMLMLVVISFLISLGLEALPGDLAQEVLGRAARRHRPAGGGGGPHLGAAVAVARRLYRAALRIVDRPAGLDDHAHRDVVARVLCRLHDADDPRRDPRRDG
jgi:hypothetical protein